MTAPSSDREAGEIALFVLEVTTGMLAPRAYIFDGGASVGPASAADFLRELSKPLYCVARAGARDLHIDCRDLAPDGFKPNHNESIVKEWRALIARAAQAGASSDRVAFRSGTAQKVWSWRAVEIFLKDYVIPYSGASAGFDTNASSAGVAAVIDLGPPPSVRVSRKGS